MPKSRLAWSCWNYLSFTKAIPLRTEQGENGCSTDTSFSEDLYSKKGKHPERLIVPVNQVSLLVLFFGPFQCPFLTNKIPLEPVSLSHCVHDSSPMHHDHQIV